MSRFIGIDFGTSNSSVATSLRCTAHIKLSQYHDISTPSVVSRRDGKYTIGEETTRRGTATIPELKRLIGLSYDNQMVKRYTKNSQVEITGNRGKEILLSIDRKELTVEEIVAFFFHQLTHKLSHSGEIVITVPASYNTIRRQAIKDAASIAGFSEVELIEETAAAAVAYAAAKQEGMNTTLIFQLGGGTIDVAIFNITKNSITVLGNACSSNLGGIDFDKNLLDYTLKRTKTTVNDAQRVELMKLCKEAKEKLGDADFADITYEVKNIYLKVSKAEFQISNRSIYDVLEIMIDMAMQAFDVKKVDEYVLIGRGCLIPHVKKTIERKVGNIKRRQDVDMKEAAAKGAAIYSESKSKKIIEVRDERTQQSFITVDNGRVFTETEEQVGGFLPVLKHSSKGVNMEIIIRSSRKYSLGATSFKPNAHYGNVVGTSFAFTEKEEKEKKEKLQDSMQKVNEMIAENEQSLKLEERVERLEVNVTELLHELENNGTNVEDGISFCENTRTWIRTHEGPFSNDEVKKQEKKFDEERRLLSKESSANTSCCVVACLRNIFLFILGCLRWIFCCGGADDD